MPNAMIRGEAVRLICALLPLLMAFGAFAQSLPSNWQTASSGTGSRLSAVTYGNGLFVAVGNGGVILTSPDGSFWTFRNSAAQKNFRDVTYGNGIFLASADTGNFDRSEIYVSTDGINWERRTSDNTNSLMSLSFGNGIFVASARSSSPALSGVASSTNGIHWNYTNIGTVVSLAFGGSAFVASGGNFQTWISSDGLSWKSSTSFTTPTFATMTYGAGWFVGVQGNGGSSASPDGINWALGGSQNISTVTSISYGNGLFVVVGEAVNSFSVSTNGLNWTSIAFYPQSKIFDVTFAHGSFVAVGDAGLIVTSPNGLNWTKRQAGNFVSELTFGKGLFVGLSGPNIVSSANGLEWTVRAVGDTIIFRDVIFAGGLFLAVGDAGTLLTSTDGLNWISRNSGTQNNLLAAAFGGGLFVVVGRQGSVITSPDGNTWTSRDAGRTDNDLTAVAFGNQMFLALGHAGGLFTSANGSTWSNIYQGTSGQRSVAGKSNAFVMVGLSGMILATTDGRVLQSVPSGATNDLNSVTYANGLFAVAAKQGRLIFSSNIVEWVKVTINTNANWGDFYFGDGLYVAIAETGEVALSGIIPPNVGGKLQSIGTTQFLTLSYSRLKSATNVSYVTAVSSNLTTWFSGAPYTLPAETNDYGATLRIGVRDSVPKSAAPKRFLRLIVAPF